MEDRDSAPVGAILTAVGGALLILGSVMTWAKAAIDLPAFANALGIDPSLIPASAAAETSKAFAGTSSGDGKVALVCGVIAILVAIAAYAKRDMWMPLGIVAIAAGVVGGGLALYDVTKKGDVVAEAKTAMAPSLAAAGIDVGILDTVFKVTLGIGIWMCVVGGLVALIGGFLTVARRSKGGMPAMAGMPSGSTPMPPVVDPMASPGPAGPDQGTGTGVPGGEGGPPSP